MKQMLHAIGLPTRHAIDARNLAAHQDWFVLCWRASRAGATKQKATERVAFLPKSLSRLGKFWWRFREAPPGSRGILKSLCKSMTCARRPVKRSRYKWTPKVYPQSMPCGWCSMDSLHASTSPLTEVACMSALQRSQSSSLLCLMLPGVCTAVINEARRRSREWLI